MENEPQNLAYDPERLRSELELDVPFEKLDGLATELGPNGQGTFLLKDVLNNAQLDVVQQEIHDLDRVPWRDNHNVDQNRRGLTIIENHDVFALKVRAGDQSLVERVPRLRALADNLQTFIRSLDQYFPALTDWHVDEMSLHRYDDPEIGLSRHRDNLRFIGLIAVLTLEGESDFRTWDTNEQAQTITVTAGDLVLNRATGLYPWPKSPEGKTVNLCPDHAVLNVRTPTRTSFILRDNRIPEYAVDGFEYDNWVGLPDPYKKPTD